ncbi:hypothetical protein [Belnapia rosea]|uniref:DUF4214 domain-containing protein n=1 Tax=Belnapia rosea TaxID=938405 RepID=A0A1G7AG48_9PROT|nr:hypothetical protein [Belnapia rosea]SDE13437.1 hypothetical protein SAMN04487779_101976 [Belnapia rosea]
MPSVQVSGSIPSTLRENARPGEWVAGLTLTGDTGSLAAIEITGPNALNFTASWSPVLGLASLGIAAPVDYEYFAAAHLPTQLSFSLRFVFTDGSRQSPSTVYRVAVLDQDDAPPSSLQLLTGGSVTAGAIGSTIGTLSVTDPDSTGPFTFSFAEEDAWRFEVVGTTLKLKEGISLGLDEMPVHPLFVQVSDGRQSAGFTLMLTVEDPGRQASTVSVLAPEVPQAGFVLTSSSQAVTLHEAREVTAANSHGDELRQLMLAEGQEVWMPAVQTLRLADGWVDYDPAGPAARAAALHGALPGQESGGAALARIIEGAAAGQGWVDLAADLVLPALAGLEDTALVMTLYQSALHRVPDAGELALQLGRLASSVSRAQMVADLAGSDAALASVADPEGIWVGQALGGGAAWHMDTGGLGTGLLPAAGYPLGSAWLL